MIKTAQEYEQTFEALEGLYQAREEMITDFAARGIADPASIPHVQALRVQALDLEAELCEYQRAGQSASARSSAVHRLQLFIKLMLGFGAGMLLLRKRMTRS